MKPYLVQLSNKTEVQVDGDELPMIAEGIKTGSPIRLRRGIINPSFIVCVVADSKRWDELFDHVMGVIGSEEWHEKRKIIKQRGCLPLKDIFKETPLQLNDGK